MLTLKYENNSQTQRSQAQELVEQLEGTYNLGSVAKLVGPDGEEIKLPQFVYELLLKTAQAVMTGQEVSLIPATKQLTTQEAADILNISRPSLIKLLESNEIPYSKIGSHRRIGLSEVMNYKEHRKITRRGKIREMTQFLQGEGFYDYSKSESDCK
jgi:excisionase family DNA binding protein